MMDACYVLFMDFYFRGNAVIWDDLLDLVLFLEYVSKLLFSMVFCELCFVL